MISVCVLSFNRPDFLKQSLKSIVRHSTEPLEIIVHDDGSSDRDVTDWLVSEVRVGNISHIVLNPEGHNEGQGIALNRMFHMASGDIIIKSDQDLLYQPNWNQTIRNVFEANEEVSALGEMDRIGCLGGFKYMVDPVDWRKMQIADQTWEGTSWQECQDFVGSFMAIPREAWESFGPFEERSTAFAEDAVFKGWISEAQDWCCALTADDIVKNVGFGEGPSTVVVRDDEGNLTSRDIKLDPHLVHG